MKCHVLFASAAAALALCAGSAQASTVTVGSVLPPGATPEKFETVQTLFNTALPEPGANLASPVNGAIVRWRVQGVKGGPFYLRVLHPNGKGAFEAAGTSLAATPVGEGLQTFDTNLPIRAGDLIGIDPTNASDEIGVVTVAGASFGTIFPTPLNGSTVPPSSSIAGKEIALSAEIQAAPAVTTVAPSFGPLKGGTEVVITGTSLKGASAVKFGTVPATNVTVDSDTQITATAPPAVKLGKVDVSVTTLAGTSEKANGAAFTYTACIVPKVTGKKLGAAKNRLRLSGCRLGKVKKVSVPRRKAGTVVKQTPKPGTVLAQGAKVAVKVVKK
ncbi:MAG TPA: IPT/TIG domain-containing protein [Solirubrobacterales bacterium]|nr:IPT/TIG domain-containing protein [Solirubrobacterales bacterium]